MDVLSLYELNRLIRCRLEQAFPERYWVRAELSDVRSNASGHCYMELIERDARGVNTVARARGMIRSTLYRMLKPYFERETGQLFTSGIKVLVCVEVTFHEVYGYTLQITDIDPSYTMGDMERNRKEILRKLADEGVLTMNKELDMPLLPQRIAVISSATAAGYGDFCNQLSGNAYGYAFYPVLFPAFMQGEKLEDSIVQALEAIYRHVDEWDVVVIIRGGGATADLTSFDTYTLALNCAQFPIPIITGIGHERDDTVIDAVAHTRVKTPTAAAEFLIDCVHSTAAHLDEMVERLTSTVSALLVRREQRLERVATRLPSLFADVRHRQEQQLASFSGRMQTATRLYMERERGRIARMETRLPLLLLTLMQKENHRLQLMEQTVEAFSPHRLLARGYSITLKDGHAVTDAAMLRQGDVLTTRLAHGEVTSTVNKTKPIE